MLLPQHPRSPFLSCFVLICSLLPRCGEAHFDELKKDNPIRFEKVTDVEDLMTRL